MKTQQLSCLVAAAEHGSVRMAALKLGRSPTAVSNALRELERELGCALIDRTPDGVILTDAGRAFAAHARLIIHQMEQAKNDLVEINDAKNGRLGLTVTPWMTGSIIGPALSRFRKRCPGVQIHMDEHLGHVYRPLREGQVDLSFGPMPSAEELQYVEATPIYFQTHAVMGRKGHPAENATTWDELRGYDWIMTIEYRDMSPLLKQLIESQDDGVQRIHYADSGLCCLSMLRTTDMLTLAPWPVVEMPGVRAIVFALNLHEDEAPITQCLVTRKDDILSKPAQIFLECFEEERINFALSDDPVIKRMAAVVEPIGISV
ncbi:LysR family transcriptional regulator [Paraburkholderia sp. ZP32-5]|uniref:LysR family transcriptional regulator n=1 Tax=Paraburkholderia sp. ZP32-5 TaxID=2883245 RepID=UPI001F3ED44C|nr:LysR family transcriptional regulator [Paraburkholderia sp. ZP32-5]